MRTLGEIQPGQTVGRYEILLPIAQGGMAAVWAARLKGSRGFSKTVAIKTMLPSISDDPQFEQMFLDEATLASRIRHPNVCEILDLGEQDDVLYQVMEWVDGEPLSNIRRAAAKQEGFPRPVAVKIVTDAAAGLHAAHELKDETGESIGLVHRDISPQNILITFDGVVKIVDFGVAKAAGRTAGETGAGHIKGKPPYMSPEQALGMPIDRRTDVFALGIILYQLTTGKHPFRGENDVVTLQNIVSDRPVVPPRAYDKDFPKPLEAVVLRALERDADKRFQSAAELEAALDRVFPPSVARVRTEDVGRFVQSLLGERGEERRAALREALRQADERALGLIASGVSEEVPTMPVGHGVPRPSGLTHAGLTPSSVPVASPGTAQQTPYGTQTPSMPPAGRSRGAVWIALAMVVAALLIGGAVMLSRGRTTVTEIASPQPPPTASLAEPAEPEATAEPTAPKPDDGIDPSELELEEEKAKQATAAAPAPRRPTTKAAPAPKPKAKPQPKPKSGGGFVPPPVTDPGF